MFICTYTYRHVKIIVEDNRGKVIKVYTTRTKKHNLQRPTTILIIMIQIYNNNYYSDDDGSTSNFIRCTT